MSDKHVAIGSNAGRKVVQVVIVVVNKKIVISFAYLKDYL
jgi:hypothetical protein